MCFFHLQMDPFVPFGALITGFLCKKNVFVFLNCSKKGFEIHYLNAFFIVCKSTKFIWRFQKAEEEAGEISGYRVRIAESAGTALSMLLPRTNP